MNGEMRKEEAKNSVVTRRVTICKSSIIAVSRNFMVSFNFVGVHVDVVQRVLRKGETFL